MSFYDAFKDVINIAQKADNVELYRQLLDLGGQALDLQAENARLKEENAILRKRKNNEDRIERHKSQYLTLSGDVLNLKYCSVCWDSEEKLIQLEEIKEQAPYRARCICRKCGNSFKLYN